MNKTVVIIWSILIGLSFSSCSKKEGCTDPTSLNYDPNAEKDNGTCVYKEPEFKSTLKLTFSPQVSNGQPLVLNQIYTDSMGYLMKIELFKFYVSQISLIKDDNSTVMIKDVALINASNNSYSVSIEVEEGSYKGIKFGIGLDSLSNATDPAAVANDHPLSIFQNTYWSWSTQFRFVMFEGRCDTLIDTTSNLDHIFLYHTGTNVLYTEHQKNTTFSIAQNSSHEEVITLDINKIFYNLPSIDIKTESLTHSSSTDLPIAIKFTDNFKSALD